MLRLILFMLHDLVKRSAQIMTDHELLKRELSVFEVDSDGEDVESIYSAFYKSERARIIALLNLWYSMQTRVKSKSEYFMMQLQKMDERSEGLETVLDTRVGNYWPRNHNPFGDDQTNKGKTVKPGRVYYQTRKHDDRLNGFYIPEYPKRMRKRSIKTCLVGSPSRGRKMSSRVKARVMISDD